MALFGAGFQTLRRTIMNRVKLYAMLVGVGLFVCITPGQTVSGVANAATEHADRDGVPSYAFTTLMVAGAVNTDAWDINNHGLIVGHYVASNVTHGFVANRHGRFMTIDAPGAVFTQATAINDRGDIAGTYRLASDSVLHAYLRHTDGSFTNIDVPGATSSLPRDIDTKSNVTFEAVIAGHTTAYLRSDGAYLNIEPPASFAGDMVTFSYASGINKRGAIVGRYDIAAQGARGYLLAQADRSQSDEAYTALHFPNAASSAALGINRKGAIVGGYTKDGVRHGYVLIDNIYTTLDVPGCLSVIVAGAPTCTTPRKVNNAGQVVGFYGAGGTTIQGFLADPVKVKELTLQRFFH